MEVGQQRVDSAESKPRRDEGVRTGPERSAARDGLEDARVVVVPTASTSAAVDPLPGLRLDAIPLAVELVRLERLGRDRPERVQPTWSVIRSCATRASSSGVKWRPAVGAAAEPVSVA